MVAAKECKHLAAQLFADSVARHGIEPGLTVHSDRGAAMKSDTLAQLLATLGASQSFSRPHVSDDNAFSEAQFKTLKYQPDYPGLFTGMLHARGWLELFFTWHNDDHQHSGLALFTPAEVFFGRVAAVHAVRQKALDAAYALHPGRFPQWLAQGGSAAHGGAHQPARGARCLGGSERPTRRRRAASEQISDGASRHGEYAATRDASIRHRGASLIESL